MTKQEKIKEGIQGWVDKRFGVPNTFNTQLLYDFLVYLNENDVVIKAEKNINEFETLNYITVLTTEGALEYGAFEPLIKEGG